jgi:hypothetical protein
LIVPAQTGIPNSYVSFIIWDNKTPTANANSLNAFFYLPEWVFGNVINITFSKFNANPASSITSTEWLGYLNGTPQTMNYGNVGTFNASTVITDNASTLKVNTNGLLDPNSRSGVILYDLAICNLLTDKEVKYIGLNDGALPGSAKSKRIVHYDFNQKTGTQILDLSGNNLHSTLYGTSTTSLGASNQWLDKNQSPILI